MNHFYMNSDHAYHSNVITDSVWAATNRIFDRIERGNIVSVCVGSRKVELTLAERYALYKENCAAMQADVHETAAANPDEPLLNMYTNVAVMAEQHASHEFLDVVGCPRKKDEKWQKSPIEKLWEGWGCGMEKHECV